jgi:hypothetical protein
MQEARMRKIESSLLIAAVLALGLQIGPAHAQLARTFVSSFGSDANDCNRLTPCRTFQHAHDTTLTNGEITVLDPGSYGAVHINRNVSIIDDGVGEAGIIVSGGNNGITIDAPATDAVTLRGITIKGIGFGGGIGIRFNSGAALTLENCTIRNLTPLSNATGGNGVEFRPITSSLLSISHTVVSDNGANGVWVAPQGPNVFVHAVLDRVEAIRNTLDGVYMSAGFGNISNIQIHATMSESVAAGNRRIGVHVETVCGTSCADLMTMTRSVVSNNATGLSINVNGIGQLAAGGSTIALNSVTWAGFNFASFGDNYIGQNFDGDRPPDTPFTRH